MAAKQFKQSKFIPDDPRYAVTKQETPSIKAQLQIAIDKCEWALAYGEGEFMDYYRHVKTLVEMLPD